MLDELHHEASPGAHSLHEQRAFCPAARWLWSPDFHICISCTNAICRFDPPFDLCNVLMQGCASSLMRQEKPTTCGYPTLMSLNWPPCQDCSLCTSISIFSEGYERGWIPLHCLHAIRCDMMNQACCACTFPISRCGHSIMPMPDVWPPL